MIVLGKPIAKCFDIHTKEEVDAEVERLRPKLAVLVTEFIIRPWCLEEDLRREAYNRLTIKKAME